MTSPASAAIVQPGKGRELRAFGDVLAVMLGGAETNQTLAVMFDTTPPGGGPPPHVHSREDELFWWSRGGSASWWTERGPRSPRAGRSICRGARRCYRNTGTTVSRQWIITTPSGFEHFFARCADESARAGGLDMERIVGFARDQGIEFLQGERGSPTDTA